MDWRCWLAHSFDRRVFGAVLNGFFEIFLTREGAGRLRLGESSERIVLISLRIGRVVDHLYKFPLYKYIN